MSIQPSVLVPKNPVVCMADDNAKAAIDEDMCGSLKVGGAPPMAAYDEAVSK